MTINLLANANSFSTWPFPHICIENALPEKIYDELEASFPENLICDTLPLDGGITFRYKANQVLFDQRVKTIWKDFFLFHTSPDYFRSCIRLFEPYLEENYPSLLDVASRQNVTIRNIDNSGCFVTDCQFVVHEPIDENGTSRTPHLDNPIEIYAGLLYMRNPLDKSFGGNLNYGRDYPDDLDFADLDNIDEIALAPQQYKPYGSSDGILNREELDSMYDSERYGNTNSGNTAFTHISW